MMMTSNRLMVSTPCGADYRPSIRRTSRRSSGLGQMSWFEAVADTADVLQVTGLVNVGFELFPQTADVVVDDAVGHERVRAPRLADQLRTGQDAAARANEGLQQPEFQRRQGHRLATAPDLRSIQIDVGVTDSDWSGGPLRLAATQQRC